MSRKIEGDWRVEYDNCSDDDGGFDEWWTVTNGEMSFRSYDKSAAEWLLKCIHGRATAKVDRGVLIRFLMWAWANSYMQHSYKSGLDAEDNAGIIADKFLSTQENKGGGNG
ncbi:MAG: hypothetical protein E6Q97_21585 [Desulfurellales bacterium]|nr:MAG: hypothetical protein E6Q97_21585 [Desulfurellales bacterium]